jgi:hypothetical protein
MQREGKIADEGPGHNTIPDPRRFVYIEACGDVGDAALAFAVGVRDGWIRSDRGVGEYRIVRDGCFRAAIPLSAAVRGQDVHALRAIAYTRAPSKGRPAARAKGPVILRRVNTVFMLDERYQPGPPLLQWQGTAAIVADGAPFDLPIR